MMSRTTLSARALFVALSTALCVQPLLAKSDAKQWVGTWASAPLLDAHAKPADQLVAPGTTGVTLREVVHVSIGGEMVRVHRTTQALPLPVPERRAAWPFRKRLAR